MPDSVGAESSLDCRCARLWHHRRLPVSRAGIFPLREPPRPSQESGERGRCGQLRAADWRGAAGAACTKSGESRFEAVEFYVDRNQPCDLDRFWVDFNASLYSCSITVMLIHVITILTAP